jgi:hypothetical protein
MKLFDILRQQELFVNDIKQRIKNNQITINNEIIRSDIDLNIETEDDIAKIIDPGDFIMELLKSELFRTQLKVFGFENLFGSNIDNELTRKINEFIFVRISKKEMFLLKKNG